MRIAAIVLEEIHGLGGKSRIHGVPIHRIRQVDIKIRHHRPPIQRHVCRRREVGLLQILHIADQRLLGIAARARIPFDCALVDHDREGEARMVLRFFHYQLGGLVNAVIGSVPVKDHSIDAPADHVRDLPVHLGGIGRTVPYVHMIRSAEPEHEVSVDLCLFSRIQQRMHVYFADVARSKISVGLGSKTICSAGIVLRLQREGGGGNYVVACRGRTCRGEKQNCSQIV